MEKSEKFLEDQTGKKKALLELSLGRELKIRALYTATWMILILILLHYFFDLTSVLEPRAEITVCSRQQRLDQLFYVHCTYIEF